MSTAPGKSADLILWARDLHLRKIGWADVANVLQEDALNSVGGFNRPACAS